MIDTRTTSNWQISKHFTVYLENMDEVALYDENQAHLNEDLSVSHLHWDENLFVDESFTSFDKGYLNFISNWLIFVINRLVCVHIVTDSLPSGCDQVFVLLEGVP